jgi:hypothetical protein
MQKFLHLELDDYNAVFDVFGIFVLFKKSQMIIFSPYIPTEEGEEPTITIDHLNDIKSLERDFLHFLTSDEKIFRISEFCLSKNKLLSIVR